MTLQGRFAVITGASRGLGAEIARRYVSAGASVFLCGRNGGALDAFVAELRQAAVPSQRIEAVVADVADKAEVDRMIDRAHAEFGRIDILVNNAGLYGPMGRTDEVDWDEWVHALNVNLLGVVATCRAVMKFMRPQRYGKIVNISGGGATNPMPRITSYATSKAALVRFSESLALELQEEGIDVNAIAPGTLNTGMMGELMAAGPEKVGAQFYERMKRIADSGATPLDIGASLAVYLGSAESDGITGRLISAVWDPWPGLQERREALARSDIYTLRRIVPADRGLDWGQPK
jgi:3-oxoacyl-[acyl-carrier protein] reductase